MEFQVRWKQNKKMTNYQPEIEEIQPFVLISREILGMFLNSLKPYLP